MRSNNIPQIRLEPILLRLAEKRNPGKILFGTTVVDFVNGNDSVLVTVRDADGKETQYQAKYLVAADGGKTIGPKIGVTMQGPTGKLHGK